MKLEQDKDSTTITVQTGDISQSGSDALIDKKKVAELTPKISGSNDDNMDEVIDEIAELLQQNARGLS